MNVSHPAATLRVVDAVVSFTVLSFGCNGQGITPMTRLDDTVRALRAAGGLHDPSARRVTVGATNDDPTDPDVYLCRRVADLPFNEVFGLEHHYLLTGRVAAGMGPCGGGVPGHGGVDLPFVTDVCINDHSSEERPPDVRGALHCDPVLDVDEMCVEHELVIGMELGKWTFWNHCQTFAAAVIRKCSG